MRRFLYLQEEYKNAKFEWKSPSENHLLLSNGHKMYARNKITEQTIQEALDCGEMIELFDFNNFSQKKKFELIGAL